MFCNFRRVMETDIVMPEEARTVARELGVPYYETSVLTYFGIDEMFENAIRAALCTRRQASLFGKNTNSILVQITLRQKTSFYIKKN